MYIVWGLKVWNSKVFFFGLFFLERCDFYEFIMFFKECFFLLLSFWCSCSIKLFVVNIIFRLMGFKLSYKD